MGLFADTFKRDPRSIIMKITRSILAVAAALSTGVSAHTQPIERTPWKVSVPFNFTVRHTSLQAGKYLVRQTGNIVLLTSQDGKSATMLTNAGYMAKAADKSSLTFAVNGGEHDLVQVKNMGSNTALDAVVKHTRKPIAASVSAQLTAPQTVEVAAIGSR
jgi:hypothetical protein